MSEYNFDEFPDRHKEKCRKWDLKKIEEHFGPVKKDIIPMWIADMDFKAPIELLTKLHEAVDIGVFGYTYVYDEFFTTIINYYQHKWQVPIKKDWITLCYGTVGAIHNVVQAFCLPDDYVIIQTPAYEPFKRAIDSHGARCLTNRLIVDGSNRYQIDFEDFEQQLRKYHPKMYILCSPHNPSGRIWSASEIEKLLQLCQKYNVLVVSDEVHSGMVYGNKYVSTCHYADIYDHIITLSSPNKTYNIGGLKTSFAIIANPKIQTKFLNQLAKNSITSPSVFGIIALIACLNDGEKWSQECQQYIGHNYEYFTNFINCELENVTYMEMDSSYLIWVNITKTKATSDEFTREMATDYGVLVESGNNFVDNGEGWIRFNLGTQFVNIGACCQRMKMYLSSK